MAEQTFKSPGFFEQEIDLSERQQSPSGVPAGIIGTADKGPAFVPVVMGTFFDFETRFGSLDPERFGPYAVREWLKNRQAVTYMRVLGAGSNDTASEIETTRDAGTVANAGFTITSTAPAAGLTQTGDDRARGVVQFICAKHFLSASEGVGFPVFTDNDSFDERAAGADSIVNLVRAVVLTPTGTRMMISDGIDETLSNIATLGLDDFARLDYSAGTGNLGIGHFKLILSSTAGSDFSKDDGIGGVRIMTASLNPSEQNYIANILNTDPTKFQQEQHLLYADFAVEQELAVVCENAAAKNAVAVISGSALVPDDWTIGSAVPFRNLFGRFDTRYTTPRSTVILSQPYGNKEYELFHFEALSDGSYGNDKVKISIANVRASTDPANLYGTFEVQVRRFSDTDTAPQVIERYPDCNLNANDENYIARVIGDKKVFFDFDQELESERRLVVRGKYPNKSVHIRVVMKEAIERDEVPDDALPFGFAGVPTIKTSNALTDSGVGLTNSNGDFVGESVPTKTGQEGPAKDRLAGFSTLTASPVPGNAGYQATSVTGSIIPPLPFRFKTTRGNVATSAAWVGEAGNNERVDNRFYWGVKFERMPKSGSVSSPIHNTNVSSLPNPLIPAYTKFLGISKAGSLVTGSGANLFNNNKFSLSRVALYNGLDSSGHITDISASAKEHMLNAAYLRNGVPDAKNYAIVDPIDSTKDRITFATLIQSSSIKYNAFTDYAKFTFPMYGGFDGINILDFDNYYMNDKSSSTDSSAGGGIGKASTDYSDTGLLTPGGGANCAGTGKDNNIVFAYRAAAKSMLDELVVNTNILAIPGIRDSFITDYAGARAKEYAMAIYIMDLAGYDESSNRIFSPAMPSVDETADSFTSRAMDNNYVATYFPDVVIEDPINNRRVTVPSSIAAIAAYAFNDKVGYPWFAPAGFNRAALDFVKNLATRLSAGNRDKLYEANINPIAIFPNSSGGKSTFVIFGQKTVQLAKSALDRVNVRRMLLEVKRQVVNVANRIIFEPNTPSTRQRFVSEVTPLLGLIQSQAGIEAFKVICDDSNNTNEDVEGNRLNGRIVVVPTRAVEFISIDFIVTNSGVSFE